MKDVPVFTSSVEEFIALGPEGMKGLSFAMNCGGFYVIDINEDFLSAINLTYKTDQEVSVGKAVIVLDDLKRYMSADEIEACIQHEKGHCFYGHLDNANAGLLVDVASELEADAYAAEKVSREAMLSALMNIPRALAKIGLELGARFNKKAPTEEEAVEAFMSNPDYALRIETLSVH